MTEGDIDQLLAFGREQRGVEFKRNGSRDDKTFLGKVVRAVLGMANRQDGGVVILGIDEETDGSMTPVGLTETELATWNYDDVSDSLAQYADPLVSFELAHASYKGQTLVVLSVGEFEDVPVLCKRDLQPSLRNGACYVRSRRKIETAEIPTHTDMRDLLTLATNKALRKFLARAQDAGATLLGAPSDTERYAGQLGELK